MNDKELIQRHEIASSTIRYWKKRGTYDKKMAELRAKSLPNDSPTSSPTTTDVRDPVKAIHPESDRAKKIAEARQDLIDIEKMTGVMGKLASDIRKAGMTSTGIVELDKILGGGVPAGRFVEIYGTEHSGKTSLSLQIAAQAQKKGDKVAFIDAENTFDEAYAIKLGVDMDLMRVFQEACVEKIVEMIRGLVTKGCKLVIVDSIASMVSKAELAGRSGDAHMGLKARAMSQALRILGGTIKGCTVIFLNQLRKNIGIIYGNPEFTPGGVALNYHATQRIEMRKQAPKDGYSPIKVKIIKNKVGRPFGKAVLKLSSKGLR